MDLLGMHKVTFETLRSLAIQCHALDLSAYPLFVEGTHADASEKAKATYEELFTSQLLNLAIALRVKFYQGIDPKTTIPYVRHCGLLDKKMKNVCFSMKDVCDKIIHADKVEKYMEKGVREPTTTLRGKERGEEWEF